jgi:hypothetical protein
MVGLYSSTAPGAPVGPDAATSVRRVCSMAILTYVLQLPELLEFLAGV